MDVSRRAFLRHAAGLTGVALLGAACVPAAAPSGGAAAGDEAQPAASSGTSINVWWATGPEMQGVISAFQDANPDIKVELAELGEAVYGNPKYVTAVAAGTGPDVAYQNRHTFHQFAARKLYRPIDDLFERDGMAREDFPATQLDEVSWEGALYGLPYVVDTRFFYWNRRHFEEVGLDPDVGPASWDDLIAFTEKLIVRNGDEIERYGLIPGFPPGLRDQLLIFAIENGARTYTEDFRTCLLADPEWVETLEWIKSFYANYCGGFGLSSGALQGFAGQAQDAFVQNMVSMSSYGSWMISAYAAFPDLDYDGTAIMPVSARMEGQNINWACDWSFVIDPNTDKVEPAWTFVKFAISPEGFEARGTQGIALAKQDWERQQLPGEPIYAPPPPAYRPAREHMQELFYSQLPDRQRKMKESELDAVAWAQGCGNLGGMAASEIWTAMAESWEFALTDQATPEAALTQAASDVQKALDTFWEQVDSGSA
ncbi:MAG: extracellular solute-binding protein [Caldilineaceae bacterium]|nr:extracellular solute-binding protein [Caldilineaceae bacterium]